MHGPDLDRERSELQRSLADFLVRYNENLPTSFPRATPALLREFRGAHAKFFKVEGQWSLDLHRKKVMDWLTVKMAAPSPLV